MKTCKSSNIWERQTLARESQKISSHVNQICHCEINDDTMTIMIMVETIIIQIPINLYSELAKKCTMTTNPFFLCN